jgi:hypothetical protein
MLLAYMGRDPIGHGMCDCVALGSKAQTKSPQKGLFSLWQNYNFVSFGLHRNRISIKIASSRLNQICFFHNCIVFFSVEKYVKFASIVQIDPHPV